MKKLLEKSSRTEQTQILREQYKFIVNSFAIEGLHIPEDLRRIVENCLEQNCTRQELQLKLKAHIENNDFAVC